MPLDLDPITTERVLRNRGFDPNAYDIDATTGNIIPKIKNPVQPSLEPIVTPTTVTTVNNTPPTPLASGIRGFARSILPSGAAIGTGVLAAQASLPLAAVPFVGPILPPLIGIGAGIGASFGASKLQEAVMPESLKQTFAEDVATNPIASTAGEIAGSLPFMAPSVGNTIKAGATLKNILANPLRAGAKATPAEIANLANVGVGAGVGAGVSLGSDVLSGQPIDFGNAIIQAGANALLNKPTALSQKLFKVSPSPELTRSSETTRAKELANVIKANPDSPTLPEFTIGKIKEAEANKNPELLASRIFKSKNPTEAFDIAETDARPPRYMSARDKDGNYESDNSSVLKLAKKHFPELLDEKGKPLSGISTDYLREAVDKKLYGETFEKYKAALEESADFDKRMKFAEEKKAREKSEEVANKIIQEQLDTKRFGDFAAEQELTNQANAQKLKQLQEAAAKAGKKVPKELPPNEVLQNPVARPVNTTAKKASVKEANYQAFKAAQSKGDFVAAKAYNEPGFLDRFQAENRGEVVPPFEPVSNLGLKNIPSTPEHPKQTVAASKYGPPRRTLFQEGKPPKYPNAETLEQEAAATGKKPQLTKAVYDYLTKTFGPLRGIDYKLDADIKNSSGKSVRGLIDITREAVRKATAKINPFSATPDTVGHEGLHAFIDDLENYGSSSDKKIISQMYSKIESSPEFQAFNEARVAGGKNSVDANEFMTETTGYDVVRRLFNTDNQTGGFKQNFKDLLTAVKVKWNRASREDYSRFLGKRFIEDPSFKESYMGDITPNTRADISDEKKTTVKPQEEKDYGNIPNNEGLQQKENVSDASKIENTPNKVDESKKVLKSIPDDWTVIVQSPQQEGDMMIPGYVQFDAPGGRSVPQRVLRKDGYDIPDFSELPQGKYSFKEASEILKRGTDTKYQDERDESIPFETSAVKILRDEKTIGLKNDRPYNYEQLLNTVKNKIPPAEYDMLKMAGIEEFAKKIGSISPRQLESWIKENGPKVEVHSYGMEGKVSEAKREYDRMTHEWYDTLSENEQRSIERTGQVPTTLDGEDIIRAKRYIELIKQVSNEVYNSPRATSAYEQVSAFPTNEPMPEWTKSKEGKNVQRVDVVIPKKLPAKYDTYEKWAKEAGVTDEVWGREKYKDVIAQKTGSELWQPDNLHENLPNTLGWALIQYKDAPNGEKIAVIVEAQSRWGQWAREQKRTSTKESLPVSADHPLLKDYNRLILKAAIDQARKEGASHIVVSDAETAMMTEGHDINASSEMTARYKTEEEAKQVAKQYTEMQPENRYEPLQIGKHWVLRQIKTPTQEPGMRLNYDSILPKIAEELTGVKGERVTLGEHKNAYINDQGGAHEYPMDEPRQNLIFKNPDGSPKTDISGMMYDISNITKRLQQEPPTLFNRKFQDGDDSIESIQATSPSKLRENINTTAKDKTFAKTNVVTRIFKELSSKLPVIAPDIDKFELRGGESAKRLTPNLREYFDIEAANEGKYLNPSLETVNNLARADQEVLFDIMTAEDRTYKVLRDEVPVELLPAYDELRTILKQKQLDQIEAGQPVLSYTKSGKPFYRDAKVSETYFPQVVSTSILDTLLNQADTPLYNKLKDDFIRLQTSRYNLNETQAKAAFDDVITSYGGPHKGDVTGFGAVNRAEGIGLPDSWLESDLGTVMRRYWRRVSKARAWFDAVESDETASHILGYKRNSWGKKLSPEGNYTPIPGNETLNDILNNIQGRAVKASPVIDAVSRIASNAVLGPITGINDTISAIPTLAKFIPGISYVPGVIGAATKIKQGITDAKATGRLRENISAMQDLTNPASSFVEGLRTVANSINKVTGREALETVSRGLSQAVSDYLVGVHKTLADSGNVNSKTLLTKLANGKDYNSLPQTELASRMAQIGQGTYDVRDVPSWMIDSQIAPFFRMSKWSTGQLNNLYKHVLIPASKGNMTPLLMTLGGGIVGGYLAKEMREKLTGKKTNVPSWAEIQASEGGISGHLPESVYNVAAAISYSGVAGLLSDLTKAGLDINFGNAPQGFNYPAYEIAGDMISKLAEVHRAIVNEGENPTAVLPQFFKELFTHNTQVVRLAFDWYAKILDKPSRQDKEARRDLRVFRQLSGKPVTPFGGGMAPDYSNIPFKEFKQMGAEDLKDAPIMLKDISEKIIKENAGNYDAIKQKFSNLRRMPFNTMPSPTANPKEFSDFVAYTRKTKGEQEMKKRLSRFATQRAVNEIKQELVPKF